MARPGHSFPAGPQFPSQCSLAKLQGASGIQFLMPIKAHSAYFALHFSHEEFQILKLPFASHSPPPTLSAPRSRLSSKLIYRGDKPIRAEGVGHWTCLYWKSAVMPEAQRGKSP